MTRDGTALDDCIDQAAFDDPNATCGWLVGADGHVWVRYATTDAEAIVDLNPA